MLDKNNCSWIRSDIKQKILEEIKENIIQISMTMM